MDDARDIGRILETKIAAVLEGHLLERRTALSRIVDFAVAELTDQGRVINADRTPSHANYPDSLRKPPTGVDPRAAF